MPDRVIKNPNRSVEDVVEARIPQYKKLGIDPSKMEYKSSVVPDQLPVDTKNISNKKLPIRQDYGIKENLPIGACLESILYFYLLKRNLQQHIKLDSRFTKENVTSKP